jgi:zinc transporter
MSAVRSPATTPSTGLDAEAQALPGLVWAFRFHADGSSEELAVDEPIAALDGWLWLHFNLTDARACKYLKSDPDLPVAARELLTAADGHQQLHANEACVYGIFADLVCGLSGVTDEIGFLHFAMTEQLLVSGRRYRLNAIEATRRALLGGRKVATVAELIEIILANGIEAVESLADGLAEALDRVEERVLIAETSDQQETLARVRKVAVRLHRQLATQRSLIHRFDRDIGHSAPPSLRLATGRLAQRLDWLDHEIVALRDRAHLLQEEVSLTIQAETNRNLQVLAIVTTIFLPANLIAAVFGMNVGGLPLTAHPAGFLWALVLLAGVSALVFWVLKKSGLLRR